MTTLYNSIKADREILKNNIIKRKDDLIFLGVCIILITVMLMSLDYNYFLIGSMAVLVYLFFFYNYNL